MSGGVINCDGGHDGSGLDVMIKCQTTAGVVERTHGIQISSIASERTGLH